MLTEGILNPQLRSLLARVRHTNTLIIADYAFGRPHAAQKGEPPIWAECRQIIKESKLKLKLEPISKWDFYKVVESPDHVLTIQTGDQALRGNVLLTMGCRT